MAGPFTTPVAFSTPFLSEPDRSNGFTSKNVQEAIEEALERAISNDRFLLLSQYGGQANNGRVLEIFAGLDSEEAPVNFDSSAKILTITCSTTSNNSNAELGLFDVIADPGLATPLYTFNMDGNKTKTDLGTALSPLAVFPAGGALTIAVVSGSIQKPHMQITFSSAL